MTLHEGTTAGMGPAFETAMNTLAHTLLDNTAYLMRDRVVLEMEIDIPQCLTLAATDVLSMEFAGVRMEECVVAEMTVVGIHCIATDCARLVIGQDSLDNSNEFADRLTTDEGVADISHIASEFLGGWLTEVFKHGGILFVCRNDVKSVSEVVVVLTSDSDD